ncbi:MAG: S8 family serine peptidase [Verrucomicrobiales bacterium]|nr:S8 family serine peptidase [Verrucomicrobiales bacterium]
MKARFWSVISLLCFLAAIGFWLKGNQVSERRAREQRAATVRTPANGAASVRLLTHSARLPITRAPRSPSGTGSVEPDSVDSSAPESREAAHAGTPFRLRNTTAPVDELSRRDSAILLRNAFIDTTAAAPEVPAHLRSGEEPGSYIVQARGAISPSFRAALSSVGARIVSYIPNNAYLIRAGSGAAQSLRGLPVVRAVLPYDPYFKLSPALLPAAVAQEPLLPDSRLYLTLFEGARDDVAAAIATWGARIIGETRSPFGPRLTVAAAGDALVAAAGLPGVQLVEPVADRVFLNDLTRVRLGVSPDSTSTNADYLELTGSNIWVNVNDTGVDAEHPDLAGRVFADDAAVLADPFGHGTHVAGTIASSGENSPAATNAVPGSVTNADFRGLAPAAKLFVMGVDLATGPVQSDIYLQETAAATNYLTFGRTNPLVSNNSWGYRLQFDYDTAAASFDAAVRDALPGTEGSQSMIYVFSAGNDGAGNDFGQGGEPGTINSPGTAKNVITVGGIDSPRFITNEIEFLQNGVLVTNAIWYGETDSDNEVAPFSSRGNVGLGTEGEHGRFKPDLVAPGAFVASLRSEDWTVEFMLTNEIVNVVQDQVVRPDVWNDYSIPVPANAARLVIQTLPGRSSPSPMPELEIYARYGDFPQAGDLQGVNRVEIADPEEGTWYYSIGNTTSSNVNFNILTRLLVVTTEDDYREALEELNQPLEPDYRFASGTSSAAASVSGLLALIQEFFEDRLELGYSPALLKALLINRAHSLGPAYSFQPRNLINYQGWGLPELPRILPAVMTNSNDQADWPVRWFDQSPTNAVATGQVQSYDLELPEDAQQSDLRITLVWTDPPGNPAASVKLVNDLDLVLSNTVTGEYFIGNNIAANSDYNLGTGTNDEPLFDNINNVENVFLRAPLDTNYVIQVIGRRVNVNAVTAQTNNIVQDYALVMSLASATNSFTVAQADPVPDFTPPVDRITNGIPLLRQRVGANSPLLGGPAGTTNQWHFYAFTNVVMADAPQGLTNGPYVAFITFSAPNMSVPRQEEADIDLYVSRGDPGLLSLDPQALANAFSSVERTGTEQVAFTNSFIGEEFYVAVKSEDQMASEYNLIGLSSEEPFGYLDEDGNQVLRGLPVPAIIPDGSPVRPGGVQVFAVGIFPGETGRVLVENTLRHEVLGDLYTELWHGGVFAGLHNHASGNEFTDGLLTGVYDDSQSGESYDVLSSDGPGSLIDFLGTKTEGPWIFSAIDNASSGTGIVDSVTLRVRPNPDLTEGYFGTVLPNQWEIFFVDVPPDASSLKVILSSMTGPLNVYVRRGAPPTLNEYDKMAALSAPGGELEVTTGDVPPLTAGRYFIGLFNPSAVAVDFFIRVRIERDPSGVLRGEYLSENPVPLGDDLRSTLTNTVDVGLMVTDAKVGLRVDHPRASDLAFHLVSPRGTRVLLVENRGGTNRSQLGFEQIITNFHHVALSYDRGLGEASLYLDGELQISANVGDLRLDTRDQLFMGVRPVTNAVPAQYFGALDEVTLFSRALTPGEILGIYKFGGAGKPEDSIVSLWPFEGSGADAWTNNPAEVLGPVFMPGRYGQGLDFRQTNDLVRVTNLVGLDVGAGAGFTLDGWINPADLAEDRTLAVWSNGTNTLGLEFGIRPGATNEPPGFLYANLRDTSGADHPVNAPEQGLIVTNGFVTNLVYVTLTDDTNIALVPIKFAEPDTAVATSSTNRLVSGLEPVAAQPLADFVDGQVFDGWTVLSNGPVSVFNAPEMAHTGTNLMALRSGTLVRDLVTITGRTYTLNFVHRSQPAIPDIISWWRGEGDAVDAVDTNHGTLLGTVTFGPALVGDGFEFQNDLGYVEIAPDTSLDLTHALSIETWFRAPSGSSGGGLLAKRAEDDADGVNYAISLSPAGLDLWFEDPEVVAPESEISGTDYEGIRVPAPSAGVFHHLVGTFEQTDAEVVTLQIFLDGELVHAREVTGDLARAVNEGPLYLGTTYPEFEGFNGTLDEVTFYSRVLDAAEVAAIYNIGPLGKALPPFEPLTIFTVDGQTLGAAISTSDWETNSLTFLARSNVTTLAVAALQHGALLDSFELVGRPSTHFLPEETIKPLIGENALGDWKLEVTDRRVGATNPVTPELISWQLQLTFAPPLIPAVRLTNALPYTNAIGPNSAAYFYVEVPRSATMATNTMTASQALDLWFNQGRLPRFDTNVGDLLLFTNETHGVAVISTNGTQYLDTNNALVTLTSAPVLSPGQRYYLGMTNVNPVIDYVLRVDFDALDTNILGLTDLPFGVTIQTNIAATNVMQFYRYSVTPEAVAASFEVRPQNGDVNFYLRRAEAVLDPLPTPFQYDYASENAGVADEIIVVTPNSYVPLTAGDWYLGVLNVDTQPVDYSIRVVETRQVTIEIIDLEDRVPVDESVLPGTSIEKYFRFVITNDVPAVEFDLFNTSGRATLLAKQDAWPSPTDHDFVDLAAPGAPSRMLLLTNALLPSLIGEWYLAVIDGEAAPINFTIQASLVDPTPVVRLLTDGVPVIATIPADMPVPGAPPRPDYYRFNVGPAAVEATFALTPQNGNVDLLLRRGLPLPDFATFDYFSANPGLTPDVILVDPASAPVPLAPGDWYLGVLNQTANSATYQILVDELEDGEFRPVTINAEVDVGAGTMTLSWSAPVGARFQVQYATGIPVDGPIKWITLPGEITSTDGNFSFVDDGSQTGGSQPFKLYRLIQVP